MPAVAGKVIAVFVPAVAGAERIDCPDVEPGYTIPVAGTVTVPVNVGDARVAIPVIAPVEPLTESTPPFVTVIVDPEAEVEIPVPPVTVNVPPVETDPVPDVPAREIDELIDAVDTAVMRP